jgi:hypothetical protein
MVAHEGIHGDGSGTCRRFIGPSPGVKEELADAAFHLRPRCRTHQVLDDHV